MVYIDKKENTAVVRMASRIGHRLPLYCTAVGKAILAAGPPELVESVVAAGLTPITSRTIVDPDAFRAELGRIRQRGYSIDDGENEAEVRCVAAPVLDHASQIIGAVSVSTLAAHAPPPRIRELGDVVRSAARAISLAMGWQPALPERGSGRRESNPRS